MATKVNMTGAFVEAAKWVDELQPSELQQRDVTFSPVSVSKVFVTEYWQLMAHILAVIFSPLRLVTYAV